jgi:hypothetical protein
MEEDDCLPGCESQKTVTFILATVRTSNLTKCVPNGINIFLKCFLF